MKKIIYIFGRIFPLIFFLPYLVTIIINSPYTALVNKVLDTEAFIPLLTASQISADNEHETIKAQSIIARTNLYLKIKSKKTIEEIMDEAKTEYLGEVNYSIKEKAEFIKSLYKYEIAAKETKNKILLFDEKIRAIPYHKISAGNTRDGEAVFNNDDYTYLKSVESNQDRDSPDFTSNTYILASRMPDNIKIAERDSQGYVKSIEINEKIFSGEQFSLEINLPSSNFTFRKKGNLYQFLCKGSGHGLGFSQYGGNELAKQGKNAEDILKKYFPEAIIKKFAYK